MDYITYIFNEDNWNIFLIEDNDELLADSDTSAQVMFSNKEIYFRKGSLNLKTVFHEVWHVYFGYCYLSDTNDLTKDDIEEISAALFSDKGQKMLERGTDIYNRLIKLKEENEKTKEL